MDHLVKKGLYRKIFESPIGMLVLEADEEALHSLYIMGSDASVRWEKEEVEKSREEKMSDNSMLSDDKSDLDKEKKALVILNQAQQELGEYFAGERREFTVPVRVQGTDFQQKVWNALRKIPYGELRSYGQVAEMIDNPKACRAVGGANNRNPVMIIIPCHRVVGSDGSLVGFGGGLDAKRYLLDLERRFLDVSCSV